MKFTPSKFLLLSVLCAFLVGCYHPDIEQGNEFKNEQLQQLKLGMTKAEVTDILGSPVLSNLFDENQMTYVYTNDPNHGSRVQRRVVLIFKNDQLTQIDDSGLYPFK